MPLQSSGEISLSDVQTQFGGSNPISMSEYYGGGSYVPSGSAGANGVIPASGSISMSIFYGSQPVTPATLNSLYVINGTRTLRSDLHIIGPGYANRTTINGGITSYSPPATTVPSDNASWLYDTGDGLYYTLLQWSNYVDITSYYIPTNCTSIQMVAWGGGGGAGGYWAQGAGGLGGAGGYCTTTISSGGNFTPGHWLHVCPGHGGSGGIDTFYSGWGGGASFIWTTSGYIGNLSNYAKLATVSTTSLILVAGGGGGGGASNAFMNGGGHGGPAGNADSGSVGSISGSGAGATVSGHGTQSMGPFANQLAAGAAGGRLGYTTSTLTSLGEAHPRNLIITIPQEIVATDGEQVVAGFTYAGSGGAGVFMGASGSGSRGGTYGYSSRGAGGGATKVYKGTASTGTGSFSTPANATDSTTSYAYGGSGSYGNNGAADPNYSGNNGKPGKIWVTFS